MRHVYQPIKSPDYGVDSRESCFHKQLKSDRHDRYELDPRSKTEDNPI